MPVGIWGTHEVWPQAGLDRAVAAAPAHAWPIVYGEALVPHPAGVPPASSGSAIAYALEAVVSRARTLAGDPA